MIKYLFTNNKLIGSRLISKVSKYKGQTYCETPSHFGILFFDRVVLHSNFANGVHFEPFYFFKKKNNIVRAFHKRDCKLSRIESTLMFDQLTQKAYGASYDFMAVAYFTFRLALKWLFNRPIPDKNKWEVSDKWFCNELFEIVTDEDLSMKTPNDLMFLLETCGRFDRSQTFK